MHLLLLLVTFALAGELDPAVVEAKRLHQEGRFDEAVAVSTELLAQDPANHDALIARALTYDRLGRFGDAASDYLQLARTGAPDNFWQLAWKLATMDDDHVRAAEIADEGLQAGGRSILKILAIDSHARHGDAERALELLDTLDELDGQRLRLRAVALTRLDDPTALAAWKDVLRDVRHTNSRGKRKRIRHVREEIRALRD